MKSVMVGSLFLYVLILFHICSLVKQQVQIFDPLKCKMVNTFRRYSRRLSQRLDAGGMAN